jgi:putative glycosyltransferase
MSKPRLSIVTTLYASAPYLQPFYSRASAAAEKITPDFEIVLVNDGSPDNSLDLSLAIQRQDPRVRIVNLSRNFGHHRALMTGLMYSQGDLVFLVDSDLEEEPELLTAFYNELQASGADVVYGVQQKRKGSLFERLSGSAYFKVFNLFSSYHIPPNHLTARLMNRQYVDALVRHREVEFVLSTLWAATGFTQVGLPVVKHHKRQSSYNLRRKVAHLVNAITSSSNKPLILIFYLGCFILVVASAAALDLIVRKLFFGTLLQGWASLIVSLWLLGGITIFCLGVIGIYLAKVFNEVKRRPYSIVKDVYEAKDASNADRGNTGSFVHLESAGHEL